MKTKLIVAGVVALAVIVVPVWSYISNYNYGNTQEKGIAARFEQVKNTRSRVSTSVLEAIQIPTNAKEDIIETITAVTEGRYGEDGVQAAVVAIQEADIGQPDPALYTRIQDMINAGRTDFANEQKLLIEQVRTYETSLGNFWSGFWLRQAGYPRIDLADYEIVIDAKTEEVFANEQDEVMDLRNRP